MIETSHLDAEFSAMIKKWRIAKKLNISSGYLRHLRFKSKQNLPIRMETKIRLLQRYGTRLDATKYTASDLVAAINFYKRSSQAAKEMGVEYVVEKYIMETR